MSNDKDVETDSTLTKSSSRQSFLGPELINLEGLETRSKSAKSLIDYVAVAEIIFSLPAVMINDILADLTASKKRRRRTHEVILDSMLGHCYTSSILPQLLILTGTRSLKQELSSFRYRFWGYTRKLENLNKKFVFKDGTFVAQWIYEFPNRTKDDPVLIYFHGGGYALKICSPQVRYICDLTRQLALHRTSVLILDYTITPFMRFPVQRKQAISCVRTLEETCSRIVMLGDS